MQITITQDTKEYIVRVERYKICPLCHREFTANCNGGDCL